jgi:heme exporter protein D
MNWQSLDEFLHMGGYGLYVWGSYAVTLAVMLAEVVLVRRRHARALATADGHDGAEGGR